MNNSMQKKNNKNDCQDYLNRWQLVKEIEEREMREATFELLFKQTLSIWDIGKSLHFFHQARPSDYIWADLQKKWIKSHA
jgi:hypothetical protein